MLYSSNKSRTVITKLGIFGFTAVYYLSENSCGWVKASLEARDKILSCKDIAADALIFLPEEDRQLLHSYTRDFAEEADIKIKEVKGSRHEIFMSSNEVLLWYIGQVLDFFE